MKLIIVHYHLRPGGIRRIIELATPALVHRLENVDTVVLACGEAADRRWNDAFVRAARPTPVEFFVSPNFNYGSEQKLPTDRLRRNVVAALADLLDGLTGRDALVWAHNLGIGRNLILTEELNRACANRNLPLIAHHHDWWFDNRWLRWPEMRRFGVRTLAAAARVIFPPGPNLRHVAINHADASVLRTHLGQRAHWLPNLAERQPPPARARVKAARRWLRAKLGEHTAPVWILPCRLLRRKNVAEALLLTRWLRPEAWLVTTGGVSSADEQPYFAKLNAAAHQHHWRLRLGVLAGDETHKPTIPELLAASECVMLTSVQEGFGLPYLEAAAAGRPLIARSLPNIAPDLAQFGFRFPQYYEELRVAPGLFDWDAEQVRQRRIFRKWLNQLPRSLRKQAEQPAVLANGGEPSAVPFSRLTLTAQLEVLAHPVAESWRRCAPLNPGLSLWRERAARRQLQISRWPRPAERRLSARTYAETLRRIAQPSRRASPVRHAARALQADFFEIKLAAANLYPLLCDTNT